MRPQKRTIVSGLDLDERRPVSGPTMEPDRPIPSARGKQRIVQRSVWAIASAVLLLLVAVPLGYLLIYSIRTDVGALTLTNYIDAFSRPTVQRALWNTAYVSIGAGVMSVLVGVPLAYGVGRTNMWGKNLVKGGVLISLISPPFLVTMAYIVLLGPNAGWINIWLRNLLGMEDGRGPLDVFTILGFMLLALPTAIAFVFVQTLPAFQNMDSSLEEAARISGAGNVATALRVTLPLARPAILSGGLLAFSTSLSLYGIPHLLGMEYLTVAMRSSLLLLRDFGTAAALAAALIAMSLIALYLYRRAVKSGERYQTVAGKGTRSDPINLGRSRHLFSIFGLFYGFVVFVAPYAVVFITSFLQAIGFGPRSGNFTFSNYADVFTNSGTQQVLINSLTLAIGAASIVVVLSVVVAYIVARSRIAGRGLLDYLAILPLGIAGTAFAVAMIVAYLNAPLSTLRLYGTMWILLIAYCARFVPFGVRLAQTSMIQVAQELEEAARISGATWLKSMWFITVPLIKNGLIYAWALVVIQAFPELGASIMLIGPGTNVVSTEILAMLDGRGGLARASALSIVVFVGITLIVLLAQRFTGRSVLTRDRESEAPEYESRRELI